MRLEELSAIISEMEIVFAYDHFAEGEAPNPPFICYLLPGSDNFYNLLRHHHLLPMDVARKTTSILREGHHGYDAEGNKRKEK